MKEFAAEAGSSATSVRGHDSVLMTSTAESPPALAEPSGNTCAEGEKMRGREIRIDDKEEENRTRNRRKRAALRSAEAEAMTYA